MRRRCSSRRRTVPSAAHCKSRSERFTALQLPECLARAAKQRARSSERTRCSTKLRSIRCAGACCTVSGGCFACARNMPRRSRSPIGRKRLDRRRTIRCLFRPRAPCMERSISFRVDRGPPGHGWSAGSPLPSGWTWVLENSWWIRRSPCSACSPTHSLHLGLVEDARACVQRAYARARDRGWPMARLVAIWHGALLEVRLGNAERVAALADEMHALVEEFALAHGRTACRWFRGLADARMGAPRDAYQRIRDAYEDNVRLGMLVGASETLGYATEALFLAGDLDGAQRQLDEALADRRQAGRARVSAAALPHGGCDRSFAWRAHGCGRLGSTRNRGGQSAGGTVAGVDGAD